MHDVPPRRLTLRRSRRQRPWVALLMRVLIVFGLIGIALAVHWFDRGGLRDNVDPKITFPDILYFTMITVTTVGYGDIVPVTQRARMFDTFLVTPIRIFIWLIFVGWWLALAHITLAISLGLTIIGIPFAIQHLKLAYASLFPIGQTVVDADVVTVIIVK